MLKGSVKGLFNLGRAGTAKAVKSDLVKQKMKETANHYLDKALDSFTSDLSKRLDPTHSGGAVKSKPYCGIKKVPKGRHHGTVMECKNQLRYYGKNKVEDNIFDILEKQRKDRQKDIKRKK